MAKMSHLSKKELQTDEVLDTARNGWEWIRTHGAETRKALMIAGAAVVLIGGAWGFVSYRSHAAGSLVSRALGLNESPIAGTDPIAEKIGVETFKTPEARNAKVSELLAEASKSYPGTPAGRAACLDQASALSAKGDNAGAWKLLESAAKGDGLVSSFAEYDMILLAPAAGKTKEQIERINRHLGNAAPPIPKDILLFSLGGLYEKDGKPADAKATYLRLVSEYSDSRLKYEAQQKAQAL